MTQAKMRKDKRKNPEMLEYRLLTEDECKKLHGHALILDQQDNLAEVQITSVKTWKRNPTVEVHCKFGLYEFFTVEIRPNRPNTQLVKLIAFKRFPMDSLPGMPKSDAFRPLADDGTTFDYALPQNVLDNMIKSSNLPYHLVLSTTVWAYPTGNHFGQPISCCTEVQEAWDKFLGVTA